MHIGGRHGETEKKDPLQQRCSERSEDLRHELRRCPGVRNRPGPYAPVLHRGSTRRNMRKVPRENASPPTGGRIPVVATRCSSNVYTRDQYRYTGRGSSGFTMHYSKSQCSREALPGKEKCWQHDEETTRARYLRAFEKRLAKTLTTK